MLQGRLFSYGDAPATGWASTTTRSRSTTHVPPSWSTPTTATGPCASTATRAASQVSSRTTSAGGPEQPGYADPAQSIGATADHFDFREDDDNYFEQPGDLFRLMTGDEQQRLFDNTARAIKGARTETVETHIANCTQADPAYGEGVRKACEALGAL